MSHTFLSYQPKRRTLQIAVFLAALIVIGLSSIFLMERTAHAGGVSGGGTGGGGANGYASANGWGWVEYSVAGGGPSGYSSGTPGWGPGKGTVKTVCADANSVIMFAAQNIKSQAAIYMDDGWEGKLYGFPWSSHRLPLGNHKQSGSTSDGGTFIPTSTAQSAYASLGTYNVSTAGYTFGKNVAWFCWDFKPLGYSLSATSTADHATAKPGDTIKWTHVLKNDGPAATSQSTHSNVSMSGFSNGWPAAGQEYSAGDTASGAAVGTMRTISNENSYVVQQADVGNTLCEWMQYSPTDSKGGINGRAAHACVTIPYSYTLTPNNSTDLTGTVETNSTINVTPTISNSGPTRSQPAQWQITQIVVKPGVGVPNAAGGTSVSAVSPCGTYFKNLPSASCSTVASGNSVINESGTVISGSALSTSAVVVGDYPVGTKICFATSVQPYSSATTDWRHSAPVCLTIGSRPKVQFIGGDLMAKTVDASTTRKSFSGTQYTYGSWIEYGIFATGNITGAASGSAYAGGGLANASNCNEGQLSFTNSSALGSCSATTVVGNYANSASIPDVNASFSVTGTPAFGGGSLTAQTSGVYSGGGAISISASNIVAGKWFVLNAPGADVTINGDITYDNGTLHALADIPQVVIVAKSINITGNVKQVDAWLITKGGLNTCSDVAVTDSLSSTVCNNQLTVNGPVSAATLYLRRTAGSGTGQDHSGDPAEVFNLRPDSYMWASLRATASGNRVQTVYSTELPPRL